MTDPISENPEGDAKADLQDFPKIEGYGIVEQVGDDEIGTIYQARDLAGERDVRLTIIHSHHTESADSAEHWRAALRAAAALQHNRILPIWQVGNIGNALFFTTPVVLATALSHHSARFRRNFKIGARLVAEIAEALHFAHQNGVIHRHLNADDVLIDGTKLTYVTHFGLPPDLPSNVSSDVYRLGLLLYQLLTNRVLFQDVPAADLELHRKTTPPESPRQFDRAIPPDLERICLRALDNDPAKRYPSAGALAKDLQNWLGKRPLSVHEFSLTKSFRQWSLLHRKRAWLTVTSAFLWVALALGSTIGLFIILPRKKQAEMESAEFREQLWKASLAHIQTARKSFSAGRTQSALEAIRTAAKIRITPELRSEAVLMLAAADLSVTKKWKTRPDSEAFPLFFSPDQKLTFRSTTNGSFDVCETGTDRIMGTIALRKDDPITAIAPLMKSGHLLATRSRSGTIRVWDSIAPGRIVYEIPSEPVADDRPWKNINFAINSAGLLVVGEADGRIALHEIILHSPPTYISGGEKINQLAFDPTGNFLAVVRENSAAVEMIDPAKPEATPIRLEHPAPIVCLSWSVDSKQVAAASADGRISVWQASDGRPVTQVNCGSFPTQIVFSNQGTHLLTTGFDRTIRLWNLATGVEESRLSGFGSEPVLRLSADDRWLLATDNAATAVEIAVRLPALVHEFPSFVPQDSTAAIGGLDFSFDHQFLVVATRDSLQVRAAATGQILVSETDRPDAWWSVAFAPFSQSLYLKTRAGELGRRPLTNSESEFHLGLLENLHHFEGFDIAGLNSDGRRLGLVDSTKKVAGFFNADNFKNLPGATLDGAQDLEFNASGSRYALSGTAANPTVYDMETGNKIHECEVGAGGRAAWSPDGKWIVASGAKGCRVWSANDWTPGPTLDNLVGKPAFQTAFSKDGRLLAVVADDGIELYSGKEFTPLFRLPTPTGRVASLQIRFSRDGSHLGLLNVQGALQIWHLEAIRQALAEEGLAW